MSLAPTLSIVLPAKNEATVIADVVRRVLRAFPGCEILVIDDGSTDQTGAIAEAAGARVIQLPRSMGNGAAIKTGARAASGEVLVFLDGDGQHDPADIPRLLAKMDEGYDMVVGARGFSSQANVGRGLANTLYNRLASWMVNSPISDLTSGFRAVRANKFRDILYLLPNGFSYPTTSTMAFFRAARAVAYVPVLVTKREGKSHLHPIKDGVRFLLIIFKIGTLYSPLKLFAPIAAAFFLAGTGWYAHTYLTEARFTNMSALLYSGSIIIFLMGLISEQITALMYKDSERN